jgi:hypothetical protein
LAIDLLRREYDVLTESQRSEARENEYYNEQITYVIGVEVPLETALGLELQGIDGVHDGERLVYIM